MNIAIIIAGGNGRRMGTEIPKQFLQVKGIPIIVYTMLVAQHVEALNKIVVVVPEGWEREVDSYKEKYELSKIWKIVPGGSTRLDSTFNALKCIYGDVKKDDVVCLIDANRPMVPASAIEESLDKARLFDSIVTLEPIYDSVYLSDDGVKLTGVGDRNHIFRGQTPEAACFETAYNVIQSAKEEGILDRPLCELMLYYRKNVISIKSYIQNFKITTIEDLELFKAYLEAGIYQIESILPGKVCID